MSPTTIFLDAVVSGPKAAALAGLPIMSDELIASIVIKSSACNSIALFFRDRCAGFSNIKRTKVDRPGQVVMTYLDAQPGHRYSLHKIGKDKMDAVDNQETCSVPSDQKWGKQEAAIVIALAASVITLPSIQPYSYATLQQESKVAFLAKNAKSERESTKGHGLISFLIDFYLGVNGASGYTTLRILRLTSIEEAFSHNWRHVSLKQVSQTINFADTLPTGIAQIAEAVHEELGNKKEDFWEVLEIVPHVNGPAGSARDVFLSFWKNVYLKMGHGTFENWMVVLEPKLEDLVEPLTPSELHELKMRSGFGIGLEENETESMYDYYQEMFETQAKPTTDGVVEACNLASRFQRTKSQIHGWRSWNVCTIVLKLRERHLDGSVLFRPSTLETWGNPQNMTAVQLEKAGLSVASAWDEAYGSKNRKAQRNEEEGEASDDETAAPRKKQKLIALENKVGDLVSHTGDSTDQSAAQPLASGSGLSSVKNKSFVKAGAAPSAFAPVVSGANVASQKQSTLGSFFSGVAPQTAVPKKAAPKKESKEKGIKSLEDVAFFTLK